jgi:hypothetical protein
MPRLQESRLLLPHLPYDFADLMVFEIDRLLQPNGIKPDLCFSSAPLHMDMWRLAPIATPEEESVTLPPEHRRHVNVGIRYTCPSAQVVAISTDTKAAWSKWVERALAASVPCSQVRFALSLRGIPEMRTVRIAIARFPGQ